MGKDFLTCPIDFVGQRQAEKAFQIIIIIFAILGFGWGFHVQKFSETLAILAIGVGLSALLILPPWPFWNRNPLNWQKPVVKKEENKSN